MKILSINKVHDSCNLEKLKKLCKGTFFFCYGNSKSDKMGRDVAT